MELRPAAFLDRDGVLNVDHGYVGNPDDLVLLPRVGEALRLLVDSGYLLIVVTNQSGIARGYYTEEDVKNVHDKLDRLIWKAAQVKIDAYYYCPHHPEGEIEKYRQTCTCRKPQPGMLQAAVQDFPIDLNKSFMVGDKRSDILAGQKMGLPSFQILGPQYEKSPGADGYLDCLADISSVFSFAVTS